MTAALPLRLFIKYSAAVMKAQWRRVSDLLWRPFAMDFEIPDSYPDCCYRNNPTYLSRCHRTIAAIATVMPRTNI
jgi:hypothetical protein